MAFKRTDKLSLPLVSILIPAYNVENYIEECLDSVVNQTYRNLQVVVVDDGSTDRTGEILDRYSEKYPYIEVYHIENGGVANARNFLLEKAKGDFVQFVDADDWIEPEMISMMYRAKAETKADIVVCQVGDMYGDNEIWDRNKTIKEFLGHKKFSGALWNKMISRELTKNVKFSEGIHYGEDALFIWEIINKVNTVTLIPNRLYHHRPNPEGLSNSTWTPNKKGTGHLVWERICKDVAAKYPQYLEIANARFVLEDMWGLYFASQAEYPKDEEITLRQDNIRSHFHELKKWNLDGIEKILIAWILAHSYGSGKLIHILYKLSKRRK